MRKYQQLCLVVVSIVSITCLLAYRSENGRLKYVLNFFGQKEPIKEDNYYEYSNPLPVWQRIGTEFHAYSSFWDKHPTRQGGEIITLVVGLHQSIVSFSCAAELYESNLLVNGKFGFTREEIKPSTDAEVETPTAVNKEEYIIYKFICRISEHGNPKKIIFTDNNSKVKHVVGIKDLGMNLPKHQLVSCLNLLPPKPVSLKKFLSMESNILEYFYHHRVIGVDAFIVYDSEALITPAIMKKLSYFGIRPNVVPFNFPFEMHNASMIYRMLKLDCELRTINISKYFLVAEPNEYIYPDSYLKSGNSSFLLFDMYKYPEDNRFEIETNIVCMNKTKSSHQVISDFNSPIADSINAEVTRNKPFLLYRPKINHIDSSLIKLPKFRLFANRYIDCNIKNTDAENNIAIPQLWPSTIETLFQPGFLHYLNKVNNDVTELKMKPKS